VEDARALDELANDLAADYMLLDDSLHPAGVGPIIQRGHATRARQGRKAGAERRASRIAHELANEDIGPLRTAAETALPGQLGMVARTICFERAAKQLV